MRNLRIMLIVFFIIKLKLEVIYVISCMLLFKRWLLFYLITYCFPSLLSGDKGALAKSKHKKDITDIHVK